MQSLCLVVVDDASTDRTREVLDTLRPQMPGTLEVLVNPINRGHGPSVVSGVRGFRQDPWFRMAMTRLVRTYVNVSFGVLARDPICPLRG